METVETVSGYFCTRWITGLKPGVNQKPVTDFDEPHTPFNKPCFLVLR